MMQSFRASNLSVYNKMLQHGFCSKQDGVSRVIEEIKKNNKFEDFMNLKLELAELCLEQYCDIFVLDQQHTNQVIEINQSDIANISWIGQRGENNLRRVTADGMFTKLKSLKMIIYTADCAPVIIFEPESKILATIHIGWRGCLTQILEKAIIKIELKGGKAENIIMAIGPMIQKKSYVVSEDLKNQFLSNDKDYAEFFVQSKRGYNFNLAGIIEHKARKLGVLNIESLAKDTFEEKDLFFSHRRRSLETLENKGGNGRAERQISYAYMV